MVQRAVLGTGADPPNGKTASVETCTSRFGAPSATRSSTRRVPVTLTSLRSSYGRSQRTFAAEW